MLQVLWRGDEMVNMKFTELHDTWQNEASTQQIIKYIIVFHSYYVVFFYFFAFTSLYFFFWFKFHANDIFGSSVILNII